MVLKNLSWLTFEVFGVYKHWATTFKTLPRFAMHHLKSLSIYVIMGWGCKNVWFKCFFKVGYACYLLMVM
jgi:hypothetical protein